MELKRNPSTTSTNSIRDVYKTPEELRRRLRLEKITTRIWHATIVICILFLAALLWARRDTIDFEVTATNAAVETTTRAVASNSDLLVRTQKPAP